MLIPKEDGITYLVDTEFYITIDHKVTYNAVTYEELCRLPDNGETYFFHKGEYQFPITDTFKRQNITTFASYNTGLDIEVVLLLCDSDSISLFDKLENKIDCRIVADDNGSIKGLCLENKIVTKQYLIRRSDFIFNYPGRAVFAVGFKNESEIDGFMKYYLASLGIKDIVER